MSHEECLNVLLSRACSNPSEKEGWNEYTIELHCATYCIVGKPNGKSHVGADGREVFEYEIDSIQHISPV